MVSGYNRKKWNVLKWRLHLDRCRGGAQKDGGGALSKKQIYHENDLRIGHYRTVSKKQRYHENDIRIGHYRTEGRLLKHSSGAKYTRFDKGLSYRDYTA